MHKLTLNHILNYYYVFEIKSVVTTEEKQILIIKQVTKDVKGRKMQTDKRVSYLIDFITKKNLNKSCRGLKGPYKKINFDYKR